MAGVPSRPLLRVVSSLLLAGSAVLCSALGHLRKAARHPGSGLRSDSGPPPVSSLSVEAQGPQGDRAARGPRVPELGSRVPVTPSSPLRTAGQAPGRDLTTSQQGNKNGVISARQV